MAKQITCTYNNGALRPVTDYDRELSQVWNNGQGVRLEAVKVKSRSVAWHNLYWGPFIELLQHYWKPTNELLTAAELSLANNLMLAMANTFKLPIPKAREVVKTELSRIAALRADAAPEPVAPTPEIIHEWLKQQCHFELVLTPTGYTRKSLPTNFNAMSGDEWRDYYNKVSRVAWREMLKTEFESPEHMQAAVEQYLEVA